jgi:Na+-driven multidrug efflux pump
MPVLRGIFSLALPLSLGVLAASGLQFGKIWIASHHPDPEVLTILSLLQPYYLVLLAFLETLAITNQVFSAKSKSGWPKPDVRRSSLLFLAVGGLVIVALVALSLALRTKLATEGIATTGAPDGIFSPVVLQVLPLFIASAIPFFIFEVYNAALRGQGRVALGLFALAILVVVDLSVTYVAIFHWHWGFNAVMIGTAAGPTVAIPITVIATYLETRGEHHSPLKELCARIVRLLLAVGAPIFLSMAAGFASAAVIFPGMAGFGPEMVSAFLFIIRLRVLFLVPAIASGSAIAILANQHGASGGRTAYLLFGTPAVTLFYALATILLFAFGPALMQFVLPSDAGLLRISTVELLLLLLPTFFTTAIATMLQIVLEQLERGLYVLLVTVVVETATCLAVVAALRANASLQQICFLMTGFGLLTMLLLVGQFLLLLRGDSQLRGGRNAV